MKDFLSHAPKKECVDRVRDIGRQTKNKDQEIAGLMKRYKDDSRVLAVLEAAALFNSGAGAEEARAAFMEDYHVSESMSDDLQDLARAQVVEPEENLANLHRRIRDSLLETILNIDVKVDEAITPRRFK